MQPHQMISLDDPRRPVVRDGRPRRPHPRRLLPEGAVAGRPSKQFTELLKPDQWKRLIGRIAQIHNPTVPTSPSRYSLPAGKGKQKRTGQAAPTRRLAWPPAPVGSAAVSAPDRFAFVQLDVPGRLGLDDGRYLLRSDHDEQAETVVVVQTLGRAGASPPAAPPPRRAVSSPARDPPEVPFTRLTVITAERSDAEDAARRARARRRRRRGGRGGRRRGPPGRQRGAARPPGRHPRSLWPRDRARGGAGRQGSGTAPARGSPRAAGRRPSRSRYPERRRRRAEALRPQERLAAVLAGREPIDVCETLLLASPGRPRPGPSPRGGASASRRPRGAARRAPGRGAEGRPGGDLAALAGAPGEHRPSGPGGACGRAVRRARATTSPRRSASASASCAAARSWRARVRAGYPRAASTELRSSATSPSRRTDGRGVVRGRAPG